MNSTFTGRSHSATAKGGGGSACYPIHSPRVDKLKVEREAPCAPREMTLPFASARQRLRSREGKRNLQRLRVSRAKKGASRCDRFRAAKPPRKSLNQQYVVRRSQKRFR